MRNSDPISGEAGVDYVLQEADVGTMIFVDVTATGPGGEASMDSGPVGPIVAPPGGDDPEPAARTIRRKRV
jgi:hypothetical protein